MADKRSYEELRDDAVEAFEAYTGELPNDYQMGVISAGAREYTQDEGDSQ